MALPSPKRFCAALLLAVPLAACGQETGAEDSAAPRTTESTSTSATAGSALLEGRWLLRLTAVSPEHEGEALVPQYVWLTPATGAIERFAGDTFPESATGREATLLVDAGRTYALSASLPGYADGAPEVVKLADGSRTPFPSGLADPAAWSFDPTEPGLLRVVQGNGKISTVDLATGAATPEGELVRTDDEYGYSFDADTGEPYVVSLSGGPNRPAGVGDEPTKPLPHGEGTLVFDDQSLPAGPCPMSAGFEESTGAATAFCVSGQRLTVFTRDSADAAYEKLGAPVQLGFAAAGIDFAMPPAD